MYGTKNPTGLVNVRYSPSDTDTVIENGNVVLLGALDTSERDVYVGATPAVDSVIGKIALIAEPEVMVDERMKNLNEFRNPAGAIVRGYKLHSGDIFSVTAEALTPINGTATAIGHLIELDAAIKLKVVASATSGSTPVGAVIAIEGDYIVIQVA
jgi:hypothetical protein